MSAVGSVSAMPAVSSKEEKHPVKAGRPLPGSSTFVRDRVDISIAQNQKLLNGQYLTFYMGNLSYRANDSNLKKGIEKRFPITVDQVVVACSTDGRSRGFAFVTVRWANMLSNIRRSKLNKSSRRSATSSPAPLSSGDLLSSSWLAVNAAGEELEEKFGLDVPSPSF
eukprot:CAMPEP_0113688724 /NCGR_PEP_ID=MMETSP0038_2-20120614/16704_1 /TAXON_ID=2898 /ORGANISM="Cryptomonas paramecium" /LENGTH=166 /DNA_ID=CAMNT_0000609589 /DNA_START=1148 /DNA_END=1648 /DNA_ORIENTATION=- /assembly_acc=CAM_ASM_000170